MKEDRKLSEIELEALAHGRRDLLAKDLDHDGIDSSSDMIDRERAASNEFSTALKRALPDLDDVEMLIAGAMAKAPASSPASSFAAPSRSSLIWGALVGIAVAIMGAVLSIGSTADAAHDVWSNASRLARISWTITSALDAAASRVPGGWSLIALIALVLAMGFLWPLGILARGPRLPRTGFGTAMIAFALTLLGSGQRALAYEIEGEWPEPDPVITVDIDRAPLSVALLRALEPSGLGLVYAYDQDPIVTLHVRGVPLRSVLDVLLDEVPVRVERRGTLIAIRPSSGSAVNVAIATPTPPPTPALPTFSSPTPQGGLRDRTSFGGDVRVRAGEQASDVFTMGGDASIDGEVFGSVVTMGGNVDVSGVVVGDVVTMGGDIRIRPRGRILGEMHVMGGEVLNESPDRPAPNLTAMASTSPRAERRQRATESVSEFAEWVGDSFKALVRYALLFLLGLVFMGITPTRSGAVQAHLIKEPVRALVSGTLGVLAGLLLTLVLTITIIGIPGAFVVALALFFGAGLGLATASSVLGAALPIPALAGRPVLQLAVGVAILFVVSRVPVMGFLVILAITLLGFGSILLTRVGERSVPKPFVD